MLAEKKPETVYLADYREPAYRVEEVTLCFVLHEEWAEVHSVLKVRINGKDHQGAPLVLDGEDLQLLSLFLDGEELPDHEYLLSEESLTIFTVPEQFFLEIATRIKPQENTKLEGLYRSAGMFCTQCEAQGFRRITYFQDRSDVLARYTTRIEADRQLYPVLLSNGNLLEAGELENGRHFAVWQDPFPKPSYLFALVAGDLVSIDDAFTTRSGRDILLQIYVQAHNRDKCRHAMLALQKAMAWDEEEYGLEYDLDRYMIVAVDDFNMGAMENKGLNIFNSRYVLARPDIATDDDYENIEAVIAHEYFHNWTGNRVTCRDWFQLSLKEGLTVFRDQEFTADQVSPAVKRIADVRVLRDSQFPEDSGPMAHPVRPASYIEINNFYTVTVYEKGAELIRMLQTLLGEVVFKQGVREYLFRHDGTAVTTDDFVAAMETVSGRDLKQFRRWYSQAGTPEVNVNCVYDQLEKRCTLRLRQSCPPSPGQEKKEPFHIPVVIGLLNNKGEEMPLRLAGEHDIQLAKSRVLELLETENHFCFVDIPEEPVLSLLRTFSAPVIIREEKDLAAMRLRFLHDSDSFNRWEAGQNLAMHELKALITSQKYGDGMSVNEDFLEIFSQVFGQASAMDDAFYAAQLLTLPSEKYLSESMEEIDVEAVHRSRIFLKQALAGELRDVFWASYENNCQKESYRYVPALAGKRRLKNLCLDFLMALEDGKSVAQCLEQYNSADNMTDVMGALRPLAHSTRPEKDEALSRFYTSWKNDPLVLDKWFALQATAPLPETLETVKKLCAHPAFSIKNPNRVRSLIGSFGALNPVCFHDYSGAGYDFLGKQVLLLDGINPQIAARLAGNFSRWRRFDSHRQQLMRVQLERLTARQGVSRDVYEVASKSLL